MVPGTPNTHSRFLLIEQLQHLSTPFVGQGKILSFHMPICVFYKSGLLL